ncbi:hypothetical protein GCM10009745_76210 [Kribbella yunnanensis]|uniref:Uncharacterized protein n=1 Tax=Kribbella yunnanensis TaxID=190194 RepID=A0ABN2J2Q6_9ACTN
MRRGELFRYRDPSGVRGTGVVGLVVEFPPNEDGLQWIALKWLGKFPSLTFWPSIEGLLEVHGHLGASEVRWLDPDPFDPEDGDMEPGAERAEPLVDVGMHPI